MAENADDTVEALVWGKTFRRLAKRAHSLPAADGQTACDQPARTSLLEDLFGILNEVDVWTSQIGESICLCAVMLYEGKDAESVAVLSHLADEELRRMTDAAVRPEDEEEGGGETG